MDSGETRGLRDIEVLPAPGSDIRFSHRRRLVCIGYSVPFLRSEASWISFSETGTLSLPMPAVAFCSLNDAINTTRWEMLAAVTRCTHFCSYLRGAQFTLRTDHRSLRWLQNVSQQRRHVGYARWYMLLGQLSVTFEYRPGAQSLLTLMTFLVDEASVCDRITQCRRGALELLKLDRLRYWQTNLSPYRRWGFHGFGFVARNFGRNMGGRDLLGRNY